MPRQIYTPPAWSLPRGKYKPNPAKPDREKSEEEILYRDSRKRVELLEDERKREQECRNGWD